MDAITEAINSNTKALYILNLCCRPFYEPNTIWALVPFLPRFVVSEGKHYCCAISVKLTECSSVNGLGLICLCCFIVLPQSFQINSVPHLFVSKGIMRMQEGIGIRQYRLNCITLSLFVRVGQLRCLDNHFRLQRKSTGCGINKSPSKKN